VLLEAGGEASAIEAIAEPRLWPTNAKTDVDWGYDTEVQPGTGRSHPFVRGRVIGGSSAPAAKGSSVWSITPGRFQIGGHGRFLVGPAGCGARLLGRRRVGRPQLRSNGLTSGL
jgi:choline dehydrogenase-like flavoprotein